MAAVGDPALESEAEASNMELKVAPEAPTRDEACTLGSTLFSTKVLVLAPLVAVEGAPEASARNEACIVRSAFCALGSIFPPTKVLVLTTLVAKASKGLVTVLFVLATLVGATEGLAGIIGAEAIVGSTAETLSTSSVPVGSIESLASFPDTETLVGSTSSTVEVAEAPKASTRDETCALGLGSILLSTTLLVLSWAVVAVETLVGSFDRGLVVV